MVVGIMGDGDYLMGVTALWTATHYKLPCLILVANNRSFYNDELHQERVARERGRPVENKWIGQRIDEPDIDLAAMARAQGAVGIGPVKKCRTEILPRGSNQARKARRGVRRRRARNARLRRADERSARPRGADWQSRWRTASSARCGRARCSRGGANGSSTPRSAGWSTRSPARARCSAR